MEGSDFRIEGSVYPSNADLMINDQKVKLDSDGTFSYVVPLNEGDNDLRVTVTKGDKVTVVTYHLHRLTKQEVADKKAEKERQKQARADADKEAAEKKAADAKIAEDKKVAADQAASETTAAKKAATDAAAKPAPTPVAPAITLSQKNAVSKAQNYLGYSAFSHDGLVAQLEYEQFSTADATYGADNSGGDWNVQAAKKAKAYMSYSSFSRGSLIDQLEYDKFTPDQATYGVNAVGL